ncbi:MAG: ASCH domain-containing protein [Ruminococcaceae bacterium]|nr:ASCH domain-containing protein [Oscillospiraceae bacterium]
MTHHMNLNPQPFSMIAEGKKTIELRLWDEKRQRISAHDTLIFTNTADPSAVLQCKVKALHLFPDFAELYRELPLDKCGYLPAELETAAPEDMDAYYSKEQQQKYGVVGIEITDISTLPSTD